MKKVRELMDGPAEDRGAALILVLFIVTMIGLAGAALLTFSDTSVRTTIALRDQAGNTYNADGAAQVAINSLSTGDGFPTGSLFNNANNTTCFGPDKISATLDLPGFYPGTSGFVGTAPSSASVTCSADPATGIDGTVVTITAGKNSPSQAVMTLGRTTGEDGINIKPLTGTPFMAGTAKSNSNIKVVSGTLQSTAAVTAFGACTGSIVSTPSANCNTGATLGDPGYASEATVVPTYRQVPADVSTSCPNGVVTFKEGYYDNAMALTTLMDNIGACAGSTWWFMPGTYYFDFHNNTLDSDAYRLTGSTGGSGSADQWGITSGNLVAGTPTDSSGTVIASPGASPVMPGSCLNPIRSTSNKGVQFIFGGDSQLKLRGAADGEICGTYSATRPPIGVYGLQSGVAVPTTLTGPTVTGTALKMSTLGSTGLFTNATTAKLLQPDANSATWAKTTSTLDPPQTITMSGYTPPSAIPAGSIVQKATVQVTHGNSKKYVTGTNKDKLTVTFTPKGVTGSPGPAITLTPNLQNSTALVTDSLDVQVLNATSSTFANYVHDNGFTGADMAYAATLSHSGNENLDAIQINITYVAPQFRGEKTTTTITPNCMTQTYTGPTGLGCAVLSTSTSDSTPFTGAFYVQGTTYTPAAPVDLTLYKADQQALRFGVISRSLWLTQTKAFNYSGPVIGIPADNPPNSDNSVPIVFLTVYVCPAVTTSSCDTDSGAIKALRVKAIINDSAPTSTMTILSWSNLR